jgi:ABC-2 type transport system ATP-binding protein
MDTVISIRNLTKRYGKNLAIQDINLDVMRGEIFGYLGPNGSGKTTTIRTLLDFIRPTKGVVSVLGLDSRADSAQIRKRIGYLPGDIALYEKMTGRQLLKYIDGLRGGLDWEFVIQLAERFEARLDQPIRTLSKGNKQKIGLIQAFMHAPELVIMDEPTNGLDPLMQQEFYKLVEETNKRGATIFVSSHIVPEIERLCSRVGIIRKGKLVAVEEVEKLKEKALRKITFVFDKPIAKEEFESLPGVRDVEVEGNALKCTIKGAVDALVKAAGRHKVIKVISEDGNLEEIFLEFYAG